MNQLIKDVHYYPDRDGKIVFTEKFLLERGYCCGNGCRHCPFEYKNVKQLCRERLINNKPEQ